MSSPSLGAVSAGIRYQVRFFWRHALPMLFDRPRVSKVVLEHRGVDAVDDVVVYYSPPGVNERGRTVEVDFHQIKFHVAQTGAVDHEALLDPAWTGTNDAMLVRLARAWARIRGDYPSARLKLVTNWPWASTSAIAPLIRDGGWISDEFFAKGPRSAVGRIRAAWHSGCGLSEPDFKSFIGALRLSTSAVSQDDAETWLNDRCALAGLMPVEPGADHSPYDDLGARLIESGRTEHTPESLRALVEKEGLVATKDPPFKSTLAVRSFSRFAHVPETDGACVVNLTDLFDGRQALSEDSWRGPIQGRLEAALPWVEKSGEPLHVALDAHLSIAWYMGHVLDPKLGKHVVLRQRIKGKGVEIWNISEPLRPDGAESWTIRRDDHAGPDVGIVVSVTHLADTDAIRHAREFLPSVGTILLANLPSLDPQTVRDGAHARWLIDELVRLLGPTIASMRPVRVHLFLACPASLAFLLGQEARVLGPATVYEFDFGSANRAYRPGMST